MEENADTDRANDGLVIENIEEDRELMLIPVLERVDEASATSVINNTTFHRFITNLDSALEILNSDDPNSLNWSGKDEEIPSELLVPLQQLIDLSSESAKLKAFGTMDKVPVEKLVKLLTVLDLSIRDGTKVSSNAEDTNEESNQLMMDLTMESVTRGVLASQTVMYVLTSQNVERRIYLEDLIDRVVIFTKLQLSNAIFPTYDPVYRLGATEFVSTKKKRSLAREVREKKMISLYRNINELVGLLAELVEVQVLSDTTIIHLSQVGISSFFVENVSELQLSSLKLMTVIFSMYEKHRSIIIGDILASIARLPNSKRNLRTFKVSPGSEECIQMVSALILQLVQGVTYSPENWSSNFENIGIPVVRKDDNHEMLHYAYDNAMRTGGSFLLAFLNKCSSKSEDCDYRVIFENFIQDMLTALNKPIWPAAEMLLSQLGILLLKNLECKTTEISMHMQVASLEYIGLIASRLRKDVRCAQLNAISISEIIKNIRVGLEDHAENELSELKQQPEEETELEKIGFLQGIILDSLALHGESDDSMGSLAVKHARHFHIASWWKSAPDDIEKHLNSPSSFTQKKQMRKKHPPKRSKRNDSNSDHDSSEESKSESRSKVSREELLRLLENRRTDLLAKVKPNLNGMTERKTEFVQALLGKKNIELVIRYLYSNRAFSNSFDSFLIRILNVSLGQVVAIRAKALKCLAMIVEVDPSVLNRVDMQLWVRNSFLDQSITVREAAIDLIGKHILACPELIDKYYLTLSQRIRDTGVSVRKRVIKILRDICIEFPDFGRIPEICVQMIKRVNDEESIRKLVMDIFQDMWFSPVNGNSIYNGVLQLQRKVSQICDVVESCEKIGLDFFEQLLLTLFKPKETRDKEESPRHHHEPSKSLVLASEQIVDCLVEDILKMDEKPSENITRNSRRFAGCTATLLLFAKIRPELLLRHVLSLQSYLTLKYQNPIEAAAIANICNILGQSIGQLVNPSETQVAQLEEDCVKLFYKNEKNVIEASLACFAVVVNRLSNNYKLVCDISRNFLSVLAVQMELFKANPEDPKLGESRPLLRRSVYTTGLLLKHFDFTNPLVYLDLPKDTVDNVFKELVFMMEQPSEGWTTDLQHFSLQAMGNVCIRHVDFMLGNDLKRIYQQYLSLPSSESNMKLKIQTLRNLELYFLEEDLRMAKLDKDWHKHATLASIQEMGDAASGMASTIAQIYLKHILESFLDSELNVRTSAVRVIQLILQQGLVHPIQVIPYVICMSSDEEPSIAGIADKQLGEIGKRHPQFLQSQVLNGIRLSLDLQRILANNKENAPSALQSVAVVRGYRIRPAESPTALNSFIYSTLRTTKSQRRAIILSLLKQFEDQSKDQLPDLLYFADNLVYLPYQIIDEPLFVIYRLDIMVAIAGSNILQSFKETLTPSHSAFKNMEPITNEDNTIHEHQHNISAAEKELFPSVTNLASISFAINQHQLPMENQLPPPLLEHWQQNPITVLGSDEPPRLEPNKMTNEVEDDEDEDVESLLQRIPKDSKSLVEFTIGSQGCLVLLLLRQHLKDIYGITETRIIEYSPSDTTKAYDRPVNRKSVPVFNPKFFINNMETLAKNEVGDNRPALVQQYLHFKELMLQINLKEEESEVNPANIKINQSLFMNSDRELGSIKKERNTTQMKKRKLNQNSKKPNKKRKRKKKVSVSDDDDTCSSCQDQDSDPDFTC